MQTLQGLKKGIESTEGLHTVVKTMKSLAAVNIRQYERATEALAEYSSAVEIGLHVVLRKSEPSRFIARRSPDGRLGSIVFGSDQGLCGSLNEQVVSLAADHMKEMSIDPESRFIVVVGERAKVLLEDRDQPVQRYVQVPSSVSGITAKVQDLLIQIERWNVENGIHRVLLFHSKQLSGASYRPHTVSLLPVNREWLSSLRGKSWPSRVLPTFTMDWDALFSALIKEYLFISLYRAFAESLASENASRLAAMQGAEKNIEERLSELNSQYHQQRQKSITEELLDIVSGFEALQKQG
jgi:F-type H+-transporting ATPase subunit gamma